MDYYIAESREPTFRYARGISQGRPCEGYPLVYGVIYTHLVQMEPAEMASLKPLITEDGVSVA